jgi:methionyl-tRNA formyltransferase
MKAIFMGKNKDSSYKALRYLLKNDIEIPYAIIKKEESKLMDLCQENEIKVISDSHFYDLIKKNDPNLDNIDFVISFLFWKLIKKPIINLSEIGCINFHPAPLPDYRGVGGYNFAILENSRKWGVSAHFVDEHFDTGEVIKVNRFEIDPNIYVKELEAISQTKLYELFTEIIDKILNNEKLQSKSQGKGKYINIEELEEAKKIDFNIKKEEIDKKIRAFWFPPYHGANIEIDGKKYSLVNKELLNKISDSDN